MIHSCSVLIIYLVCMLLQFACDCICY